MLSSYLGSTNEIAPNVRLAAHLAYGLHNEALVMIGGDLGFDTDSTVERIKKAEEIVDYEFADNFGILKR